MSGDPVLDDLARYERSLDRSAAREEWEDRILRDACEEYIDDGDLFDAVGRIDEGERLLNSAWLRFTAGDTVDGLRMLAEIMRRGAEDYAKAKLAMRHRISDALRRRHAA